MSHAEPRRVRAAQLEIPAGSFWGRMPWIAGGAGALGVVASLLLGQGEQRAQFYFSWLVAFLFFLSVALGALFFVMVHHATKAGWGIVIRRLAESVMQTIPLFVVLFVPAVLGLHQLYEWSHAEEVAQDPILAGKQAYLNPTFFLLRAGIYFAIWSGLALWFGRASRLQDQGGEERLTRRMVAVSGPGILLFALTVTFAAFDWIMSLEPHWYSTIFGVYYFAGCLVGIFAFLTLLAMALERAGYLAGVVSIEHFHDLGKLLFSFNVFWTYIAFAQFFLIWYANIPEETVWFLERAEGSWKAASVALAVGHFVVPFLFLMGRTIKRKRPLLALGATWMLLMHLFDLHWLVMPTLHHEGFRPTLLDLTALVGVGGLFLGTMAWWLGRRVLVPVRDPRILESLSFENM